MPKITGLFEEFKNFDKLTLEDIAKWLKTPVDPLVFFNFYANRIYYPQTVAVNKSDLQWDLTILKELLSHEKKFLSKNSKKIVIPDSFLARFPDKSGLIEVFADAYIYNSKENVDGLWGVVSRVGQKELRLGSILVPKFEDKLGQINLFIGKKKVLLAAGQKKIVECKDERCRVTYLVLQGSFLGRKEGMIEVFGGDGGLLIDGRKYA